MSTAGALRTVLLALAVAFALPAAAQEPILSNREIVHPVRAQQGMVASQEALATRIGVDILRRGGNAVDAAVGVGFALAVTLPRAGNLGGGGFMLVHLAAENRTLAIDYREVAPAAVHRDMYLDASGAADEDRLRHSHDSVGVPGTVAGLALALARYGTMPLAAVMAPAIALAEDGFPVSEDLAAGLAEHRESFARWPESMRIFFKPDGSAYAPGETLRQPDLAASLRRIAAEGPDAFYRGDIAKKIAAEMASHHSAMTQADLAAYRVLEREPVRGRYRGYDILSMPPPSSGGVHLIQMLNILEGYDLAALGHNSAASIHLMTEAMRRAYADRATHLGDPAFYPVPVQGLISKRYAATLRRAVDPLRATPSNGVRAGNPRSFEGDQTTHFSVIDAQGNAVANTYTLNHSFGSHIVAAGTGILLNNEMDDFAARPGAPNSYGLLGGDANAVAPGKRPLSSMTPTILLRDGRPVLAVGSPGGSRIITIVLQTILNLVDYRMNLAAAVHAPRIHHQWQPDILSVETGISPDTIRLLQGMGHRVEPGRAAGSVQAVQRDETGLAGISDPRTPGGLTLGY
ncbi:MAG: gamma-glutamyltransferase [Alphaproteobacteria bacterium]